MADSRRPNKSRNKAQRAPNSDMNNPIYEALNIVLNNAAPHELILLGVFISQHIIEESSSAVKEAMEEYAQENLPEKYYEMLYDTNTRAPRFSSYSIASICDSLNYFWGYGNKRKLFSIISAPEERVKLCTSIDLLCFEYEKSPSKISTRIIDCLDARSCSLNRIVPNKQGIVENLKPVQTKEITDKKTKNTRLLPTKLQAESLIIQNRIAELFVWMSNRKNSFEDDFREFCERFNGREDQELNNLADEQLTDKMLDDFKKFIYQRRKIRNNSLGGSLIDSHVSGYVCIPWSYILFGSERILIGHPIDTNRKLSLKMDGARAEFCDLKDSFQNNRPIVEAICEDGVIKKIMNLKSIREYVTFLDQHAPKPEMTLTLINRETSKTKDYSQEEIRTMIKDSKSMYLRHLAQLQLKQYKICYCLERRCSQAETIQEGHAFLFSIRSNPNNSLLIFEHIDENNATVIFIVDSHKYDSAVRTIHQYFASDTINKRENIMLHRLSFSDSAILSYSRIVHTDLDSWKYAIAKLMR